METQIQMYMNVPNVPEDEVREYARHLLRMCGVARIVRPGHPWFDHQMNKFTEHLNALLTAMRAAGCERGDVRRAAARHLLRLYADGLASRDAYDDATAIVSRGLRWS